MRLPLAQIKRERVDFIAPLAAANDRHAAIQLATNLMSEARAAGLNMRDYLIWKLDVQASNDNGEFSMGDRLMNGYEAALKVLNLPIANDFEHGVALQAASSTFQTHAGTRILFPQVVDDVAKWSYRQSGLETLDSIVGSRRTIDGTEMLMTVVNDGESDYSYARKVTEFGQVPIHRVLTSEQAVKIHKFGLGWEFSYEFDRRASIDLIVPFANRSRMEIERSKVWALTQVLINGDGAYGAAPEVDQSSLNNAATTGTATNGTLSYKHLLKWLLDRAKAGTPVDTVVGNFDSYVQWLLMFALPKANSGSTEAEQMAKAGFQVGGVPMLNGVVNFVLSSAAPANKLIGITKAITSEELTENGSKIEESERSIKNQKVTFVSTENSGFRLPFGDTRSVFDYGN